MNVNQDHVKNLLAIFVESIYELRGLNLGYLVPESGLHVKI
jgi:hypothetical protein